jgi:hypothetical protein
LFYKQGTEKVLYKEERLSSLVRFGFVLKDSEETVREGRPILDQIPFYSMMGNRKKEWSRCWHELRAAQQLDISSNRWT